MTLSKIQTVDNQVIPNLGRRNLLDNGAMNISQRGTSLSMAHDNVSNAFLLDRFQFYMAGGFDELDGTSAQVADDPLGGAGKAFKWTTGTAESAIAADEYIYFTQKIEAQNLQHIQNGNSNAKPLTLSFYVKSSITGTFSVGLFKPDNTARQHNKTYTINSANTWEKKTVTFVGDTSGGGIDNDNGQGLWVSWNLAAGSDFKGGGSTSGWVNYSNAMWADGLATDAVVTTAGATWLMTQCQLEVGSVATDFEHRSFTEELMLCKRYFSKVGPFNTTDYPTGIVGYTYSNTTSALAHKLSVPMRIDNPALSMPEGFMNIRMSDSSTTASGISGLNTVNGAKSDSMLIDVTHPSRTTGTLCILTNAGPSHTFRFDAEL